MADTAGSPFAVQLRRHRLAAGLTQEALADRAGLSARGVRALESGARVTPRLETVRLLADALHLGAVARSELFTAARPDLAEPGGATLLPGRFPIPPTRLVGREAEVAHVVALLRCPEVRLVTLTGSGGVGKTRLAIAAASELAATFPDGLAFVDLSPIREPGLVAPTLARALGLQEEGGQPLAVLSSFVARRRLLLVLDNCEQVLAGMRLVADLLAASATLKVLATSRERLHLRGESELPVAPLSLSALPAATNAPGCLAELERGPAVRLFAERAVEARPEFVVDSDNVVTVSQICQRLDGLPLAIELAAARLRQLTPTALLNRLRPVLPLLTDGPRDLPARQQTMRDAIAWSYNLLPEDEQALFRRLSVFAGGFSLEAADALRGAFTEAGNCLAGNDEFAASTGPLLDSLGSLAAASLLTTTTDPDGQPRYGMLETVREFGGEQLATRVEATAVRAAHADWSLSLAEAARARYYTAHEPAWLDRLDTEHLNLRAALGWFDAAGDAEAGLRLVAALAWYWHSRGPAQEGAAWAEQLLARRADVAPAVRSGALTGAALLAWTVGQFERAAALLDEALALWRGLRDLPGLVRALNFAALVANARQDPVGELAANKEAVAVARIVGDPVWMALSLGSLGHNLARRGEPDRAEAALEEDLALLRTVGYERGMGWALEGLANNAMAARDGERAEKYYREAIALAWKHRTLTTVAIELRKLAAALALGGKAVPATRLLAAAVALREANGATPAHEEAFGVDRQAASLRAVLSDEEFATAWAAGRALPLDRAIAEALDRAAPPPPPSVCLTQREAEILPLLASGRTDREIAAALFLSPRTVEHHVARLVAKLGVRSRHAAADAARAARLPIATIVAPPPEAI